MADRTVDSALVFIFAFLRGQFRARRRARQRRGGESATPVSDLLRSGIIRITVPPNARTWKNDSGGTHRMARVLSTIVTALVAGAIGFGLGVYAAPSEGVASLRTAIEKLLAHKDAPPAETAPAEPAPAAEEAPKEPDAAAAPADTAPAETAPAETPAAGETAPAETTPAATEIGRASCRERVS
jgi:hypothetical protein